MLKPTLPTVTRANLLQIFVEGALVSEGKMRACALRALNKQLHLFRGHKGKFTSQQAERLLQAADRYMADPANQIDLAGPTLVRNSRGLKAAKTLPQSRAVRIPPQKSKLITKSRSKSKASPEHDLA
jgi:hypothetical protein